jgi:hypothetical protein
LRGFRTPLSPAELGGIVAGAILLGLCFLGALAYILTLRRRLQRNASEENNSAGFNSISVAQVSSHHTRNASPSGPSSSIVPFVSVIPRRSEKRSRFQVGVFNLNKSVSVNSLVYRVKNLTPHNMIPYKARATLIRFEMIWRLSNCILFPLIHRNEQSQTEPCIYSRY